MNDMIHNKVISAFGPDGTYRHVLNKPVSGIDNVLLLSLLAGAAYIADDQDVLYLCRQWLYRAWSIDIDCRNWDTQPHSGWKSSGKYYWDRKPQEMAGPLAVGWAYKVGALNNDPWKRCKFNRDIKAYILSHFYGLFFRIKPMRQHINTWMLACLFCGTFPRKADFFTIYNPFYSYINGNKCNVEEYPLYKTTETEKKNDPIPMLQRKRTQFPYKQYPTVAWIDQDKSHEYTPTAILTARYLQSSLEC